MSKKVRGAKTLNGDARKVQEAPRDQEETAEMNGDVEETVEQPLVESSDSTNVVRNRKVTRMTRAEALKAKNAAAPKALFKSKAKKPSWLDQLITKRSCPQWLVRLLLFFFILALSVATRFYQLSQPAHICWDETHFGKHANYYLKGEFFFDVHPPLAKLTIAFAGYLGGYDGSFPFDKPGDKFENVNYVAMRLMCVILGTLCIPLAYLTVWELTKSTSAAILTAAFILFDHGCITISQYILLDPILMFWIMLSALCLTKFHSYTNVPFTPYWWAWMVATGIALACAFSCKWVGLFVIVWAGISTVMDLWKLLGDLTLSLYHFGQHFAARVVGLIAIPIGIYLFWFVIHFQVLPKSGPGDGFFSSAFQSTLIGNELFKQTVPAELAFGSVVTMKNHRPGGALLHSHSHLYPKEHPPEQQQVTGYSHKDTNNKWIVKKAYEDYDESQPIELVKDGDWIRLEHLETKRNLHSHDEKAPLSTHHKQVTGYGADGKGDGNDFWRIEVVSGSPDGHIKTVKTAFRLIHVTVGCALHMSTTTLPKWGWEQLEVTCNPSVNHPNNLWNIEGHENDKIPRATSDVYRPSFLESVYESHVVMAQTSSGFKPKEGEVTSQPWQWPINYRGQVFSGGDYRVYLLGNPVIWWFILLVKAVFLTLYCVHAVRAQRGCVESSHETARRKRMESTAGWLLVAWALHYFPFFGMGRVLYFHHYFPAYLFSAMFAGVVTQYLCQSLCALVKEEKWKEYAYYGAVSFLVAASVISFWLFRGLTYGMSGPMAHDANATAAVYKWVDTWEV